MSTRHLLSAILLALSAAGNGFAQAYWSRVSPGPITDDICSVTYANGVFATTTAQGNVLTSIDGLVWSSQSVSPGTWLGSVTNGKGTWVVVGANGTILVSPDLKTWANTKSVTTNKLNGVLYIPPNPVPGEGGNYFVAVGDAGTILTSPDALNWTIEKIQQSSGATGYLHGITSYGQLYTVVLISGQNGVLIAGSPNFFRPIVSPTSQNLEAVLNPSTVYANSIAVGANGTIIYQKTEAPVVGYFDIASALPATSATFRCLAYGNGMYVAAGDQGSILTSSDGETWTLRFPGDSPSTVSTASLLGVAFSPALQRYVAVGAGGTILVSNATPLVLGNVSTRGIVNGTQTLIGGFVVEGTFARMVLIRADGPVLSAFGVSSPLPDPVLTVYDSSQNEVATNTGWTTNANPASISAAATAVGAFALPNPSKDAAVLLTLQPGAYTVVITSAGGNSGTALFEAYTH